MEKLNRYGKFLMPLPLPKLVVFYNGKEDEVMLCLSDAFKEEIRQNVLHRYGENKEKLSHAQVSAEVERIFAEASPDIEVKVRMLNINHGYNEQMLSACRPLEEYAWFAARVRENQTSNKNSTEGISVGIEDAIDKAIDEMPEDFVIRKFILTNRAEVKDMCLTEYNETETMEMFRQEGRQEGCRETRLLDIRNLMEYTGWTVEMVMDSLKIPVEQREALYRNLSKDA